MYESEKEDDFSEHFKLIFLLISRLKKYSLNTIPLLCLSFINKSLLSDFDFSLLIEDQQKDRNEIPSAIHYAILTSIITNHNNFSELKMHKSNDIFLYDYSISKLSSIGYKPQNPCFSKKLSDKSPIDHLNLCKCLEFVIADKSISIEKLLDEIRHLPRSFFVLSSFGSRPNSSYQDQRSNNNYYYPDNLEDSIRLWLSKFPCLYELSDLTSSKSLTSTLPMISSKSSSISSNSVANNSNACNSIINNSISSNSITNNSIASSSIELLQKDISDGLHIAAVLSRAFPNRVNKKEIFQNDSKTNWAIVRSILEKEIGAFIPSFFPVSENLFICFISEVFHATQSGSKKFVKIDSAPLNATIKSISKNGSNFIINNNFQFHPPIEKVQLNGEEGLSNKDVIRSRKISDVNSITSSIVFKPTFQKNPVRKSRVNLNASHFFSEDETENEFFRIYKILSDASYFNVELSRSSLLSLIRSLTKLFHSKSSSEQTFRKLYKTLESKKQMNEQIANGKILLGEISKARPDSDGDDFTRGGFSSSEIDLRAAQKVIDFARTMISQSSEILNRSATFYKKVQKQGFSISTQTSSMTHSMSFVRESKGVKVTSTVVVNEQIRSKQKALLPCDIQPETRNCGTQTESRTKASNSRGANWKKNSNLARFETVSYPYGESAGCFSMPCSNHSPCGKVYNSPVVLANNHCYLQPGKKFSSFAASDKNGKSSLIRKK